MKTKTEIDAVRLMREIRDQIGHDIEGMSYDQQREYISRKLGQPEPDSDSRGQRVRSREH